MVVAGFAVGAVAVGAGAAASPEPAASVAALRQPARAARLVFVGDVGTGDYRARRVAGQIRRAAAAVPVSHAFFLGDNVYEEGEADQIGAKFLDVYEGVLGLGVKARAALGNHDVERCLDSGRRPVPRGGGAYREAPDCWVDAHLATPEFGYQQEHRYYSVAIPGEPSRPPTDGEHDPDDGPSGQAPLVEVFVLDTNTLGAEQNRVGRGADQPQLRWLADTLGRSGARWKVVAMHHAMRTPQRCRWLWFWCRDADEALRSELEPIFREHGVDVVFQGHQHLYARLQPQDGIRYFVTGAGGKPPDSFRADANTVPREDAGSFNHFVYVHATEERFGYCVLDDAGRLRDSGSFARGDAADGTFAGDRCPGQ